MVSPRSRRGQLAKKLPACSGRRSSWREEKGCAIMDIQAEVDVSLPPQYL